MILLELYYGVFPLLLLLPMMVQPLVALAVLQVQMLLRQLGQLNQYHLPRTEVLLLRMQQQLIHRLVPPKITHKALLFHVAKMVLFHKHQIHSFVLVFNKT